VRADARQTLTRLVPLHRLAGLDFASMWTVARVFTGASHPIDAIPQGTLARTSVLAGEQRGPSEVVTHLNAIVLEVGIQCVTDIRIERNDSLTVLLVLQSRSGFGPVLKSEILFLGVVVLQVEAVGRANPHPRVPEDFDQRVRSGSEFELAEVFD